MKAKTTWNGNLNFTGSSDSELALTMDAGSDIDGNANGFRPMELFAIGLAGCTAMDVISILTKKQQDITGFEVQVHVDRSSEHPKVFTHAVIDYLITGSKVEEAAVLRAIELTAGKYCHAQAMLGKIMPIELKYSIFEDLGENTRRHVSDGECHARFDASLQKI